MRVLPVNARGIRNADQSQHFHGSRLCGFLGCPLLMQKHHLIQLLADPENRVQTGHRLLKNHCHFLATQLIHVFRRHFGNVIHLTVAGTKTDGAAADLTRGPCTNCMSDRLVTDFPQPDSPTTPTILSLGILKVTPSTAFTVPTSV